MADILFTSICPSRISSSSQAFPADTVQQSTSEHRSSFLLLAHKPYLFIRASSIPFPFRPAWSVSGNLLGNRVALSTSLPTQRRFQFWCGLAGSDSSHQQSSSFLIASRDTANAALTSPLPCARGEHHQQRQLPPPARASPAQPRGAGLMACRQLNHQPTARLRE